MVGLAMAVAAVLAERRSSAGAAGVTAGVSADLVAGVGARNLGSGLPFNGETGDLTLHPPTADPHGGWCGGRELETPGYPIGRSRCAGPASSRRDPHNKHKLVALLIIIDCREAALSVSYKPLSFACIIIGISQPWEPE